MKLDEKLNIFKKRRMNNMIAFLIIATLYWFFAWYLEFNIFGAFSQVPRGFVWLGDNFIPNETATNINFLTEVATTLLATIVIAVAATTTAAMCALIAAVFGSKKTGVNIILIYLVRIIAMVFRNIPLIAWSLILFFSFRQNEFTGYLALFFGTFGYLTRTFTEVIDEASDGVLEALKATGAPYFSIIFQGLLPMISSQLVSWVLFMIESNAREATLVGILTGTGIGFLFDFYYQSFRYPMAGMVLLFVMATVVLLELLSNKIRRLII